MYKSNALATERYYRYPVQVNAIFSKTAKMSYNGKDKMKDTSWWCVSFIANGS